MEDLSVIPFLFFSFLFFQTASASSGGEDDGQWSQGLVSAVGIHMTANCIPQSPMVSFEITCLNFDISPLDVGPNGCRGNHDALRSSKLGRAGERQRGTPGGRG